MLRKTLKILLVIFGLVIISASSYVGVKIWKDTEKLKKEKDRVLVNQSQEEPGQSEIDTSDWKTYYIQELGMTFSYPIKYYVRLFSDKDKQVFFNGMKYHLRLCDYECYDSFDPGGMDIINLDIYSNITNLQDWIKDKYGAVIISPISLNSDEIIALSFTPSGAYRPRHVTFTKSKLLFDFTFALLDEENIPIALPEGEKGFNYIIKSIKFVR